MRACCRKTTGRCWLLMFLVLVVMLGLHVAGVFVYMVERLRLLLLAVLQACPGSPVSVFRPGMRNIRKMKPSAVTDTTKG